MPVVKPSTEDTQDSSTSMSSPSPIRPAAANTSKVCLLFTNVYLLLTAAIWIKLIGCESKAIDHPSEIISDELGYSHKLFIENI